MRNIRARVDAVVIGAGTLRAERLSLGLDSGISGTSGSQPLAVILTTGGNLPLRDNLIPHKGQEVLVITTRAQAATLADDLKDLAEVMSVPEASDGRLDPTHTLKQLRQQRGIKSILVEGGPRLNRTLLSHGLIDELLLTLAPKLLGGTDDPRTIVEGHLPPDLSLRLISVHVASNELFLRYSLTNPPTRR